MRLFNPYYPNQAKIDIECRKTKKYFAFLCHDCFFYPTSDKKKKPAEHLLHPASSLNRITDYFLEKRKLRKYNFNSFSDTLVKRIYLAFIPLITSVV